MNLYLACLKYIRVAVPDRNQHHFITYFDRITAFEAL